MKYIDISWPISNDMTTYKNKKDVHLQHVKTFHEHNVRESTISMSMHTGTHIDMPSHFLQNGEDSNFLSLDQINGPCQVIDLTDVAEKITVADMQKHAIAADILLFKTKNSYLAATGEFDSNFIYLDASAANYLVANFPQLKSVGIDYLGIERNQPAHLTHRTLLENGIVIIEGIRLDAVDAGMYELVCLPLKIEHVEALPARALLKSS